MKQEEGERIPMTRRWVAFTSFLFRNVGANFFWYRSSGGYTWVEQIGKSGESKAYRVSAANVSLYRESRDIKENAYAGPFLIPAPADPRRKVYRYTAYSVPSTLFLLFAETPPEKGEILRFANTYGSLTYFDSQGLSSEFNPPGEPLEFWVQEINDMAKLVGQYEELAMEVEKSVSGSLSSTLSKLIHEFFFQEEEPDPTETEKGIKETIRTSVEIPEIINRIYSKSVEFPILLSVDVDLSGKYRYIVPTMHFTPPNLLSFMWYQFFLAFLGEKRYKRCAVCGKWEDVTDKRLDWSAHPECALRERARRYREKQKREEEQVEQEGESHGPSGEP